jgi:hypothetical protein
MHCFWHPGLSSWAAHADTKYSLIIHSLSTFSWFVSFCEGLNPAERCWHCLWHPGALGLHTLLGIHTHTHTHSGIHIHTYWYVYVLLHNIHNKHTHIYTHTVEICDCRYNICELYESPDWLWWNQLSSVWQHIRVCEIWTTLLECSATGETRRGGFESGKLNFW